MEAKDEMQFLWDKWKHHDALMHQRQNTFLTLQVVIIATVALIIRQAQVPTDDQTAICIYYSIHIAMGIFLIVLGMLAANSLSMIRIDRDCRNAFNDRLVDLLRTHTDLLDDHDMTKNKDTWDAEDYDHPINLWQTPKQKKKSWSYYVSTGTMSTIMASLAVLDVVLGGLIIYNSLRDLT